MRSLLRRNVLRSSAAVTPALRGVAVSGLVLVLAAGHNPARAGLVPWPAGHKPGAASADGRASTNGAAAAPAFRQIILPDLLVIEPSGLTPARSPGSGRSAVSGT